MNDLNVRENTGKKSFMTSGKQLSAFSAAAYGKGYCAECVFSTSFGLKDEITQEPNIGLSLS
jgi:hypothetical protein